MRKASRKQSVDLGTAVHIEQDTYRRIIPCRIEIKMAASQFMP